MNNTNRPVPGQLLSSMMSTFRASGKRHLLITGQKRIGKSTLCDLLLEQKPFAGLQSYACWGSHPTPDRIEMRDLVTGEVFPIGTPGQGRMEPIPEALDGHAAAILRKIPDGSDVMIDEVGYLESSCARYAKELERLFDRCTVIAALRKDHTPLLDWLRSRPDVFVWDLDLHQHPCQVGCVVMASGWSRRFSGENKLLLPVDGKPMIRHTLEKLAALPLERVTVVSRYGPVRAMAAEYGFQALDNPLMLQSDTIRLGLAEMTETSPTAPERAWKPCSGCSGRTRTGSAG